MASQIDQEEEVHIEYFCISAQINVCLYNLFQGS
jgi:hypothetical protein